jgi:hypothetical protein
MSVGAAVVCPHAVDVVLLICVSAWTRVDGHAIWHRDVRRYFVSCLDWAAVGIFSASWRDFWSEHPISVYSFVRSGAIKMIRFNHS